MNDIIIIILLLSIIILLYYTSNKRLNLDTFKREINDINKNNVNINNNEHYLQYEEKKVKNPDIFDELELMIDKELSKKYDTQINLTNNGRKSSEIAPKDYNSFNHESNIANDPKYINKIINNSTIKNDSIWNTYDKLIDDNSKQYKKYDKLENNYSSTKNIYDFNEPKGSLYFDNY